MQYEALVKNTTAPKDIKFETYKIPALEPHQSLLKVNAVAFVEVICICMMDMEAMIG
ncbi:hypothetical protein PGC35_10660 [Psychrobacillus sp. PGGUH221]|uniref:hypothetical protein n=1 Tax=Psychrobacillus sp. PGGUH221 TaxID=3020058 RepID=UPI0035C6EAFE